MQIASTPAVTPASHQSQDAILLSPSTLYSATVGGKSYSSDIAISEGQYVAAIPVLPGITAIGNTLLSAEHNLNTRVSVLV